MNRQRGLSATGSLLALSSVVLAAGLAGLAQSPKPSSRQQAAIAKFNKAAAPILEQRCVPCHNGDEAKGGVDFEPLLAGDKALAAPDVLERALVNLRSKTMPPMTAKPMPEADRIKLLDGIRDLLNCECSLDDPGRTTLRRLNRFEYANTVRDLLGVDFDPTEDFPSDDVGYGFDNIGDVLSLSPLHLEKYLNAAEKLTESAFASPKPPSVSVDLAKMKLTQGVNLGEGLVFFSQGSASFPLTFPEAGSYRLKITAYQQKAGGEDARIAVGLGQQVLDSFPVRAQEPSPALYELPLDISSSGSRPLILAFLNDYYQQGVGDRNLYVLSIVLEGPVKAAPPTRLRRELLPDALSGGVTERVRAGLRRFASRAYRRPLTEAEFARLMKLYDAGSAGATPEEGVKLALQGILTSPSFLFRVELDGAKPGAADLNGYELASRLSYFLWGSLPDEALTSQAASGALATEKGLTEAMTRMLQDSKAGALAESFAMQWLELGRLASRSPDPQLFPGWSSQLQKDMVQETKLFFTDVMRQDRSILDFIDGPYTFLNERLARHYGIPGVTGEQFRKVSLEGSARGGVITQGAVLTATSNPTRTSPVKRGKWILDVILASPPPPPPPGADEITPSIQSQTITIRQKMEQHRKNPACAVCHQKMDPLGFGLENFDAVGAWRTKDQGLPIDSSGLLPGGVAFEGPAELRRILRSRADEFAEAFASRLLTYALGRGLRRSDRCYVEDIAAEAKKNGYTFSSFVRAIVLSDPFRKRTSRQP